MMKLILKFLVFAMLSHEFQTQASEQFVETLNLDSLHPSDGSGVFFSTIPDLFTEDELTDLEEKVFSNSQVDSKSHHNVGYDPLKADQLILFRRVLGDQGERLVEFVTWVTDQLRSLPEANSGLGGYYRPSGVILVVERCTPGDSGARFRDWHMDESFLTATLSLRGSLTEIRDHPMVERNLTIFNGNRRETFWGGIGSPKGLHPLMHRSGSKSESGRTLMIVFFTFLMSRCEQ